MWKCVLQAKHWRCLRGLVPECPPVPPVRTEITHFLHANTLAAAAQAPADVQQPAVEAKVSPSHGVMNADDSHMHGAACPSVHQALNSSSHDEHQSGQPSSGSQSVQEADEDRNPRQARDLVSNEDGTDVMWPVGSKPVHAVQGNSAVGAVSDSGAVHAHSATSGLTASMHASKSNANADAVQQADCTDSMARIRDKQCPAEHVAGPADEALVSHRAVADNSSKHGHRLLAEGQELHVHAAKAAHRSKQPAQMCQGKSHQRLLLVTALHVSAHKQMKRQHRQSYARHMKQQKSI